ncbi:hypothetical protein F5X68DRAFT_258177 [Plectosphaerella plurivora]|uniref:Uncharacterized protein n=1 Tax=Plectosphaerella plurivora TaxID=936078 RepID=A0A9P8VKH1_9PEZI|nr:hypothetical protein F5X68DRAFT_258177 [Plectosphaerella plurivora]
MPGCRQVLEGHLEVWNWAETRKIQHEEWPRLANGGKIKLAFIMGHHFGHPDDRCMRCYKPIFMMKSVDIHTIFRTCTSCKLSLRRVVCEYDYEPVDGVIAGGPSAFRDYQHKTPRASLKIPMDTTGSNPGLAASQNETTAAEEPSIDLVCRRLTMQWSPIAEYVFRYYLCRCIIWRPLPLLSQDLPHGGEEQTLLRAGDCPRHSTKGKKYSGFDYGDIDYERDRYFEGFGGVKTFRGFTALLLLHKNGHLYEKLGGKSYADEEEFRSALRMIDSVGEKEGPLLEWGNKYLSGKDDGTRFLKSRISDEELRVSPGLKPDGQDGHQYREWFVKEWNKIPMVREVNKILDGRGPTQPNWVIGAT